MNRLMSFAFAASVAIAVPAIASPILNTGVGAELGHVTILHVDHAVEGAFTSNPEIVEVQLLDNHTIGVIGRSFGISTLEIREQSGSHTLTIDVMGGGITNHPNLSLLSPAKDADTNPSYVCGTSRCIRAAMVRPSTRISSASSEN